MRRLAFCFAFAAGFTCRAFSALEVIPPAPQHYFNDYAGIVSPAVANDFDRQLLSFSVQTSNQVVVAIFPKMQSDDDIAAYTQRVAESWGVGQKDKRNGIVLFVFLEDHKMIIQVGYGLEGALPDVAAFNITEYQMKPQFAAGNYEAGLRTGIDSILKAVRGEYSGTRQVVSKRPHSHHATGPFLFLAVFLILSVLSGIHRPGRSGHVYSSAGTHWTFSWGDFFFFWLNLLLSSSSRGGGGGSSSGGGGFSGGGGSFGGGGAGSSW